MPASILQQLGVLVLVVLFSLLFTPMNERKAKIKNTRLRKGEEEGN
jgi:uncharacterized membrane protein